MASALSAEQAKEAKAIEPTVERLGSLIKQRIDFVSAHDGDTLSEDAEQALLLVSLVVKDLFTVRREANRLCTVPPRDK